MSANTMQGAGDAQGIRRAPPQRRAVSPRRGCGDLPSLRHGTRGRASLADMIIRPESPADHSLIRDLTARAFAGAAHADGSEPRIIDALRAAGALTLSLVAEVEGRPVGHVAVSPVTISDGTPNWYGLGPVSVDPPHQRSGIGSELVQAALAELRSRGVTYHAAFRGES